MQLEALLHVLFSAISSSSFHVILCTFHSLNTQIDGDKYRRLSYFTLMLLCRTSAAPEGSDMGLFPIAAADGTKIMSLNLLMEDEEAPVVWRGPVIASTVKQFWHDVYWGDLDYLFVDMPPGTGDVPLTVFQSLPVDGILIVTSPQDLVQLFRTSIVYPDSPKSNYAFLTKKFTSK